MPCLTAESPRRRATRTGAQAVGRLAQIACLCAGLAAVRPADGHDSFVVASAYCVDGPTRLTLRFITTEHFPEGQAPVSPARVASWVTIGSRDRRQEHNLTAEAAGVACEVEIGAAQTLVAAVALRPAYIALTREQFREYLREERAEEALAWLREREVSADRIGEVYTKFAKAILGVPSEDDRTWSRPVGHRLEIVPLAHPCTWRVGEAIAVRVLLNGRPVSGLRVAAGHDALPPHEYAVEARTDSEGIARLTLTRPGLWYLRTHTIRPVLAGRVRPDPTGLAGWTDGSPPVGWESFWASLTFRVSGEAESPE